MILGIGTDLVDCRRIEKMHKKFGPRFVNRVFTVQEQDRINKRLAQDAGYAKLFAIKEAVLKALGTGFTGGIGWHDIEILREGNQAPQVRLSGAALSHFTKKTPTGHVSQIHVSVSDEWPYAQAFAIMSAIPI